MTVLAGKTAEEKLNLKTVGESVDGTWWLLKTVANKIHYVHRYRSEV